ncbi:MAG: MarR family winged helix-turn-helix transcriptional regulator [Oscillospiraceae bacterium]|nr:MarR family winged helix-turn-helix transcriptional regulator [Oscillospiraceae bacterium]
MEYAETQLQFIRVLDRLKRLDWSKQFKQLRPPEYIALFILRKYHQEHPEVPGMYVSVFAKKLEIPAPAASKLLNTLENNGWVTRMIDPASRRNTFILMTDAGEAIYLHESRYCAEKSNRIFERMGTENISTLLIGINQILTIMEEEFQ